MVDTVIVETEEQLALRNQQRLEQASKPWRALGLRPSNQVIRQREERPRPPAARVALSDPSRKSKQGGAIEEQA